MRNLIKKAIFFLCAALLLTSLTACFYGSGDDDDTEWKEEAYKKLTDAPPPAIHASKEPFSLGELIPPTKDSPIWEIQYGDFPVMMCSNLFTDLGNGFARAFLNFEGRDNAEPFVPDSKKSYVLDSFLDSRIYGSSMYDPEQRVQFDNNAELNLLLLTEFNQNDKEYLENETEEKINAVEIAREAVVFVIHNDNPVNGLTFEQLKDVLTGKITDWSELGWGSRQIGLYCGVGDDLNDVLDARVLKGESMRSTVTKMETMGTNTGEVEVAVSVPYEGQPEGIYITVLREAKEMDGYKILSIDGAEPDAETIRSGMYPVAFGCFAVYRASDDEGAPGRFAEWIFTQDGTKLIESVGFVPAGSD